MSCRHSDRCTREEIDNFKKEVITWLDNRGIDTKKLDIRSYRSYNGDIKIFTGDCMIILNRKISFRRTESNKNSDGRIIGWHGTRGHHETKLVCPICINKDEWSDFKENKEDCFYDDYKKLDKLTRKGK